MKENKSLIVRGEKDDESTLNRLFSEGWNFLNMSPFHHGGGNESRGHILVILEKDKPNQINK